MGRSVHRRLASRSASFLLGLCAAACFSVPAVLAQHQQQIGPRALYPLVKEHRNSEMPLAMRDAIQNIALGTRLLATEPRIIGGAQVPLGFYPWAASIGLKGVASRDGHFCVGSFIAPNWVLTAAQCVRTSSARMMQVYGNSNELERGGTIFPIDRIIVHEGYDEDTQENDIALIHVTRRYSGDVLRIIAPTDVARLAATGTLGVVVGWGLAREGLEAHNAMRGATVQVVSNQTCNGLASYAGTVADSMLCAGFPEGVRDSCQGDSGAPLIVGDGKGDRLLIGIVSWGEGCARPLKFGVYTRASAYFDWIKDRLAGKPQPPRQPKPQIAQTLALPAPAAARTAANTPASTQTRSVGAPAASPPPLQLGPRSLYPQSAATASDVPIVMRDAQQFLQNRQRLLALKPRIMGGEPAPANAYPFMASISVRNSNPRNGHFCGGSFVTADWVLTAAHCVKADQAANIQVYGGSNELSSGGRVYGVTRVIVHERYDSITQENDIALLQLSQRAAVSTVSPLPAAEADRLAGAGTAATAIGWGLTSEGGDVQNALRRVGVEIVSNQACNAPGAYAGGITDGMLCAGFRAGGRDSCQGDSGGPLVVSNGNGTFYQAGVVSWGEGCGQPNKYGVYTRVSAYRSWIADRVIGRTANTAPASRRTTPAPPPTPATQNAPTSPRLRNGVPSNSRAEATAVSKKRINRARPIDPVGRQSSVGR